MVSDPSTVRQVSDNERAKRDCPRAFTPHSSSLNIAQQSPSSHLNRVDMQNRKGPASSLKGPSSLPIPALRLGDNAEQAVLLSMYTEAMSKGSSTTYPRLGSVAPTSKPKVGTGHAASPFLCPPPTQSSSVPPPSSRQVSPSHGSSGHSSASPQPSASLTASSSSLSPSPALISFFPHLTAVQKAERLEEAEEHIDEMLDESQARPGTHSDTLDLSSIPVIHSSNPGQSSEQGAAAASPSASSDSSSSLAASVHSITDVRSPDAGHMLPMHSGSDSEDQPSHLLSPSPLSSSSSSRVDPHSGSHSLSAGTNHVPKGNSMCSSHSSSTPSIHKLTSFIFIFIFIFVFIFSLLPHLFFSPSLFSQPHTSRLSLSNVGNDIRGE